MERAATAAQTAAEAAARAAAAAEKIAGINQPAAAAAAAAPTEPPPWTGTVGMGLIWLAGNSETVTFSGNAAVQFKTEHWIFAAKGSGVYGESTVQATATTPETSTVIALAAALSLRGDRRFTERVTGYVLGGVETDHVKSIEVRGTGEAGSGITWAETVEGDLVKFSLRTDLAFRYSKEQRFQYYPTRMDLDDVDFVAPKLGLAFRYAVSKDLVFTEDAEILPNIVGDSRYLLNSLSKLSVRLTSVLSFGVGFEIKHDSLPAPGKEETDSALTIGLEVAL